MIELSTPKLNKYSDISILNIYCSYGTFSDYCWKHTYK